MLEQVSATIKIKVMKKSFYIVSLYPYNDVYQVIDNIDDSVVFQGSEDDCKKYKRKNR
tara:strand:+ start:1437 stop:1610 length:174 start_codon:yes stop_codon:yes gene_type:complete